MKIESIILLEPEMKGNSPTILNENEYEVEQIELFEDENNPFTQPTNNKFKVIEMDECYVICKTPEFPLTLMEKKEYMMGLINYDNLKDNPSKPTHFCVLTTSEKSKLVTYKANENATYYLEIVGLKNLDCDMALENIKKIVNK